MGTLLSQAFREQVSNTKDFSMKNEMTYSVSYPTGFINIDFANGYIQEINGVKRYELGISDGSLNMMISDSGVGKTTLVSQIACNIIKPYSSSCIFYEQAEVGTNIQRIKNLSKMSDEVFEKKFIVRDAGITTESIYKRVKMVHDIKTSNPSNYNYDTGIRDFHGNPIYKFEPTVFIIDSVKMVLSEKATEAEETTNMTGAQTAKTNSEYYGKMVPLCRAANIIVFFINHITTSLPTNSFLPQKAEFPYLKQGEHVVGGRSLAYIQNNIFRLDVKSKYKPEEGFGIVGSLVNFDVVKSRTSTTSRAKCSLVFDQSIGYDNELSLFNMLKDRKLFEGSGAFLRLPGYDAVKFSQKKFKEYLYSDQQFFNTFVKLCIDTLKTEMLEEYERIQAEIEKNKGKSCYEAMLDELYTTV